MSRHNFTGKHTYRSLLIGALLLGGNSLAGLSVFAASPTPGTVIENQATGSYIDESDNSTQTLVSDKVTVTVGEVVGITITPANTPSATTGSIVNFDFTVTNVGNDPTQFFIPDAPSAISGGTAGTLQIVAYDPDGSGPTAAVDLTSNNVTVPSGGQNTGTLLGAIASANNGSIPAGATIVVRVPVTVTAAGGQTVSVTLGNTSGQPSNSNTPYILGANGTGSKDLYTVDNADNISGESAGAPLNGDATNRRQEASAAQTITVTPLDFGDAPASYGTLLADNGARHTITGLYLGAAVSADTNGQPNATATGDTNDDGVTFNPTLGANYSTLVQAGISNQVRVVSSSAGFVNAWIDYNQNGVFDSGEQILTNQAVVAGTNTLTFTPDNRQLHGFTFVRFRLSPTSIGSPSPVGLISGGEVEDYQVYVAAPVPDGAACATTGLLNGGFENPTQGANSFNQLDKIFAPGWNTSATDQKIEIWSTPYQGVTAYLGNQFAEINATQVAILYQDIVTVPGSTLTFQFAHRARKLPTTGPDVVDITSVKIGAPGAAVQQGIYNTDSTDWVVYRGTYLVPANQYITRFEFNSISAGSGFPSVGNFIDGVNLSVNSCVPSISPPTIDLDGNNSTATGNNYQNTFTVGGAAVAAADTDVVITDEKTNITRAIIQLTTTPDGATESLTIDPTAGGTVTGVTVDLPYDSTGTSTTGRLTLKGSATLANYQKVIATLKYSNTKASPTMSDRIINVQVIDSDKAISNTAISTIKMVNPVTISGTVFSDADADVTINGSDGGTNAGSANLTIYAVDTAGKVVEKATVAANAQYSLAKVPINSSVTLRLSNDSTVAIGATAPTASSIPSGWYYTGQNLNGTVDGTIATLGNIALTTTTSNLTNQNFGIRQAYTITADTAPTTCNPDYRTALNTGISAAGGQLAVGTNDLNWTAEWIAGPASGPGTPYAPPRPVGTMPAVVVGNLAPGAWINEPANVRWISYPFRLSVNSNGTHTNADLDGINAEGNTGFSGPGTSDDVRLKFTSLLTLPSNANTISISLPVGVAIDNQFVSIKVNGVENLVPTPAANPLATDFGTTKNVNITNGWQAGVNTIEVVVDSGPNQVGFFLAVQATTTQVCSNPNVLLVKRITAINGDRTKNPNDNTPLNAFVDDTTSTRQADDNSPNWKSGYLLGAIDGGKVKPGDEIEHTIYFLNAGSINANTVRVCDRISANQDFKVGAYGTSKDVQLQLGTSTVLDLTSASDTGDRAQLISAGGSVPANCYLKAANDNGSLVIDVTGNTGVPNLTTMPGSTGQGSPNDSYGFLRFITKVKP